MKTIELNLEGRDYVVGRLDAKQSSFICMTIFTPLLLAMQSEAQTKGEAGMLCNMLMGLDEAQYNRVVDPLFALMKVKEGNKLCNIFSQGQFIYANIADDPFIFMSLLKAAIELSFGDFFDSAARIFPFVAVVWEQIKGMSTALASVKI